MKVYLTCFWSQALVIQETSVFGSFAVLHLELVVSLILCFLCICWSCTPCFLCYYHLLSWSKTCNHDLIILSDKTWSLFKGELIFKFVAVTAHFRHTRRITKVSRNSKVSAQNPVYVLLIFLLICFLFIEDIFEDNFMEKKCNPLPWCRKSQVKLSHLFSWLEYEYAYKQHCFLSPVIFGRRAPEACSGASHTSQLSWWASALLGHGTLRTTSSNGRKVAQMVGCIIICLYVQKSQICIKI